jgi:hypothetical protein
MFGTVEDLKNTVKLLSPNTVWEDLAPVLAFHVEAIMEGQDKISIDLAPLLQFTQVTWTSSDLISFTSLKGALSVIASKVCFCFFFFFLSCFSLSLLSLFWMEN